MASASGSGSRAAAPGGAPGLSRLDTSVAHPARILDYWLGGKDNFAADRAAADYVLEAAPFMAEVARTSRAFHVSVVRYLAGDCGIRQFLDIGAGLPSADSTHEVAQRVAPESRVVYMDNDPMVLAHARALLTGTPQGATACVDADARDAGKVLALAARTLDFTQPVAVMLLGVLPFIPDADEPAKATAQLADALPPGSFLAISHGASDIQPDAMAAASSRYNERSAVAAQPRTEAEFRRFFHGLQLVAPGVVPVNHWRPRPEPDPPSAEPLPAYAALGRK